MTSNIKRFQDLRSRFFGLKSKKHEAKTASPEVKCLFPGAGGCHLCEPCAFVDGQPCRNPKDAVISLEASGIEVMQLMIDHGTPYANGKSTVTFSGGIMCRRNL